MLLKARCPRSEEDMSYVVGHGTHFSRKPTQFAWTLSGFLTHRQSLASYGKQQLILICFYPNT